MCLSREQYKILYHDDFGTQSTPNPNGSKTSQRGIAKKSADNWQYPVKKSELFYYSKNIAWGNSQLEGTVGVPIRIEESGFISAEIENIQWSMNEIEQSTCIR